MSTNLSMIDAALEILQKSKKGIPYSQLFKQVAKKCKLDESQMKRKKGQLYSQIMEDPNIAMLEDNIVDLKQRHTYEKTHAEVDYDDSVEYDSDISLEDKHVLREEEENSRVWGDVSEQDN